jgi:hypothetical protein
MVPRIIYIFISPLNLDPYKPEFDLSLIFIELVQHENLYDVKQTSLV